MTTAIWDQCEDCFGSGGHHGDCGACGGTGKLPANDAAFEEIRRREVRRQDAIWAQAARDVDDDHGDYDHDW